MSVQKTLEHAAPAHRHQQALRTCQLSSQNERFEPSALLTNFPISHVRASVPAFVVMTMAVSRGLAVIPSRHSVCIKFNMDGPP
mmetsp:Transcript_3474/g.6522  ORF Transcript_3474/g.6522 Transcript_3474/m.6522 type:complete len:84 (-) Transcript_3474:113-364(-)